MFPRGGRWRETVCRCGSQHQRGGLLLRVQRKNGVFCSSTLLTADWKRCLGHFRSLSCKRGRGGFSLRAITLKAALSHPRHFLIRAASPKPPSLILAFLQPLSQVMNISLFASGCSWLRQFYLLLSPCCGCRTWGRMHVQYLAAACWMACHHID